MSLAGKMLSIIGASRGFVLAALRAARDGDAAVADGLSDLHLHRVDLSRPLCPVLAPADYPPPVALAVLSG